MEYSVNLNMFQGPFDLLFHLIETKEIDIYDIPISEITEQYLEYLEQMRQFNMNITSEFILMAATLIEIKSQMLLPKKEKDEDPRLDLVNKLLEYKLFKDMIEKLKEFENESSYYFSKPKEEMCLTSDVKIEQLSLNEFNIYELFNIYCSLIKNQNVKIEEEKSYKIYKENYSVKDCIDYLLKKIKKYGRISLFSTFKEQDIITKEYIITTFLAILELSNKQGMKIYQNYTYSDILITYN
ncbi:MAG: segregation/condensation protein A [Tissierellia bacterium]|nr:segregation/condensation protein A [Tissierellia bacterium]MDD4780500.1 segregation/condensation protein A [Tissierellia bacterium]